jgi:hypothetical protein
MSDSHAFLPPRARLLRAAMGLALVAGGCAAFAVSKALDPQNRAALVGILGVVFGLTYLGQGIRGHSGTPITSREEHRPHVAIAPATAVLGMFAGWIVPGLGHWIAGLRTKAVVFFATITVTFAAGVLLAEGRNLDYDRDALYFLAYVWNAGETAIAWLLTRHLERDHVIPTLQVGFLYSAVAGLLNLVVLMDFAACCSRRGAASGAPAA